MPRDVMSMDVSGSKELVQLMKDLKEDGFEAARDGFHNWVDYVDEITDKTVPVDDGGLASSKRVEKHDWGAIIRYLAKWAQAVHWGYVRHFVRPKRRKALRWEPGRQERLAARGRRADAQYAFSKGHYVPARKARSMPNPWLVNGVKKAIPFLSDFVFDEFDKQIPEAA